MATMDEGVQNLERFIGFLVLATGELGRMTEHLTGKDLSRVEEEAAEQGGGLNERLEELESVLDSAEDAARDAVEELRDAAGDAHEAACESQERLEEAVEDLDERAQDVANDVDESHARLVEQGFEGLGRTVDELEQDLEAARDEATTVTSELVSGIEGFENETQDAFDAADAAVDHATSEAETLESSLEASAADAVQGMESEAGELEAACSSLEGDLTTIYEGLAESADVEQQALCDAIRTAAQEATHHVETGEQERLEQPAQMVEAEAFNPLGVELGQLAAVLASAAPVTEALPPLTADLTKCQAVVGQIDELLQAIAG